jgi:hypothetical protein
MLDDMLDQMARLRERPVWTKLPDAVRASFRETLPTQATPLDAVYRDFQTRIEPYSAGNTHPRFMGWVQGGGTAIGALAEMLAAGMNANCGGRDHAAIEVERQIARWSAELFGFPESASGIFVTGTSIANFIAVTVARTAALGATSRRDGIAATGQKLTAYVSTAAHGCIRQAMELAGFGSEALRLVPTDSAHRIDLAALRAVIARDRAAGAAPFFLVGNAGTVDTGAIDDLDALASLARAGDAVAGIAAAFQRHRACGFDRFRFSQIRSDPLRRRFHPGARQRAASRRFRHASRLSAARGEGVGGWFALAMRFWSRSVARLPRVEDVVHAESLWQRAHRWGNRAELRARALSRAPCRCRVALGVARAGDTQHRLLPLSRA